MSHGAASVLLWMEVCVILPSQITIRTVTVALLTCVALTVVNCGLLNRFPSKCRSQKGFNNIGDTALTDTPIQTCHTVRYERGVCTDRKYGHTTRTGTYVIIERLPDGDMVTAYTAEGRIHWSRCPLLPADEARWLANGMWYRGDQLLPEGF